ncbi:MAG: hypothetical protein QF704_06680, partial [Anaerolineales bacterium]|nr:hypothetical protein [Anaerolineales bacterium]
MRKSQFYPVAIIASILFFSVNCSSANKAPKSIILIVADGAGIGHQTALYYLTDDYAPARFENVGLVTTYML